MSAARKERVVRRLVLACSLALGLMLGGGIAWAYWSATVTTAGPAPLTSGTFDLQISFGGGAPELVGPGGTVELAALSAAGTGMGPGQSLSQELTVINAGSAAFVPAIALQVDGDLEPYVSVSWVWGGEAQSDGSCSGDEGTSAPVVEGASTADVCLEVTFAPGAPEDVQGDAGGIVLTMTAAQPTPSPTS